MPGVERLHLEEALEDSPQTRNLLGVFEKDGLMLKNYILQLNKCCARMITAQREMTAATQALSAHLKVYDQQRFPLETEGSIFSETVIQFAQYLDELSTVHQILATQMGDGMMFPISKFIQADLDELTTVGEMYKMSTNDLDESLGRYMKLSKKKDNEKVRQECCDDVYQMRKKFHQTALHYYSSLNALQYKRKSAILEPMVGLMTAQKAHFTMGSESTAKTELKDFLANTTASIQGVKAEMAEETNKTVELIEAIEENSVHLYHTEPSPELPYIPPNPTLNQKGGYLFVRNKQNILNTKWERCYFFIQGGNLMSQARDQFAGSLVLDLNEEGVVGDSLECDDRRHVFHVVSPKHKKSIILQAENGVEKEEWISTINNAARDSGYSKDFTNNSSPAQRTMSIPVTANRPAVTTQQQMSRSVPPPTPPSSPQERSMTFDAPIQFDIITPSEQDRVFQQMVKDGPPKRINPFDQASHDIIGSNVSGEGDFSQSFVVRFLGSMEVKADRGEHVILESMRQIMAARAIHNIFKTTESHLVVSSSTIRLLDPSNNSIRTMFLLEDISFWAAHSENKRLLGFIVRNKASVERDRVSFSCFVFECNTNADEICHAIGTATKLAYHALLTEEQQQKLQEQKKKETSLLLANISALEDKEEEEGGTSGEETPPFGPDDLPLSPDGQYVLLTDTITEDEAPPTEPDPTEKEAEPEQEVEVESEA